MATSSDRNRPSTSSLRRAFGALAAFALLAACGGSDDDADPPSGDAGSAVDESTASGEDDDGTDTGEETGDGDDGDEAAQDDGAETVTAVVGGERFAFSGGRCFVTEDGGSQGGISLSGFVADDLTELSLDWAGDSPTSSMARIALPDGRLLEASSMAGEEFDVSISGSSATVSATFVDLFAGAETQEELDGTIEISC